MVQAARSGYQNIAEGSEDSATSRKLEMNLTNVAKSSLGELGRDYHKHLTPKGCIWPG
jgi:predicted nuclease of restriction endonuclease-like (RecB) superfamily